MAIFKNCLKWLARRVCGEYALYSIYQWPGVEISINQKGEDEPSPLVLGHIRDTSELKASPHVCLCELVPYAGEEAYGFGAWYNGSLVAACWFWVGQRYKKRGFWPLKPGEAKLIQIVTAEKFRGQGIARKLIQYAVSEMQRLGYERFYARIWHSNHASIAAFERAGWVYCAFVTELFPFGVRKPLRITRTVRRRPHRQQA